MEATEPPIGHGADYLLIRLVDLLNRPNDLLIHADELIIRADELIILKTN